MPGEKTEKATPKRKEDERKKGNVFLSQEVITVASLFATFYGLRLLGPSMLASLEAFLGSYFSLAAAADTLDLQALLFDGLLLFARTALPILLISSAAAIVATLAQTRMLFSPKAASFKGERISPLQGFKRMFSMRAFVELLKAVLKIMVLGGVIYMVFSDRLQSLPRLMDYDVRQGIVTVAEAVMDIVSTAGIVFLALAAGDYLFQWWQYEKNLRMSKQEVKDEYKQMEGDPQVKGHIRSLQQQRARRRMMQSVPGADVVVRNPTHYAVALRYDPLKQGAPVLVAKGMDRVALRIVSIAQASGVYVTEDPPLARALYAAIDIGQEIPEDFYQAIAELLAYVYSLKKERDET